MKKILKKHNDSERVNAKIDCTQFRQIIGAIRHYLDHLEKEIDKSVNVAGKDHSTDSKN